MRQGGGDCRTMEEEFEFRTRSRRLFEHERFVSRFAFSIGPEPKGLEEL